jgi:hypothetical protein
VFACGGAVVLLTVLNCRSIDFVIPRVSCFHRNQRVFVGRGSEGPVTMR